MNVSERVCFLLERCSDQSKQSGASRQRHLYPRCDVRLPQAVKIRTKQAPVSIVSRTARHSERQQQQHPDRPPPPSPVVLCGATGPYTDPTANGCSSGRPIAAAPKTASKIETMAEAQRLIGISLAKIAQSRVCRGGVSLHKNLLVATEDGAKTTLSYDCDTTNTTTTTILPTTIGSLGPLEPLNMCRNNGSLSAAAAPAGDTHEQPDEEEEEEEKQTSTCQDVAAHLFLLPALAPWIGAPEDNKENIGSSFSFLPAAASPFHYHHDEEEEEQEEDDEEEEEEENTCQDLSCHRRKQEAADHQPELARKQLESAVRSKGALRYFDLDDRRTARHERRRRRHRTEGDDEQQAFPSVPAKRRRSSDWDRSAVELPDQQSTNDDRIHPIPLLSAKRLKTIDNQQQQQQPRPLTPALCPQPQFYSSPHETICPGDAETLSACVNQQLEAENLSTSGGGSSNTSPPLAVEEPEVEHSSSTRRKRTRPPRRRPRRFGNLSRSVSTPDVFCAAQAQKDARPDAGGSLLTSQLQHHGQRGYLTMTV
uniref:Uncharacterized protein n=1 Tax=Anopheles coluzzii TaxID=1518534 RepID=A0A8W7PUQ9_ANOCL